MKRVYLSAVVADLLRVQSATNVYSLVTFDITPDNLHAFHMVIQSLCDTTCLWKRQVMKVSRVLEFLKGERSLLSN